jgi:uncharacterized protein YdcH (DUF465 family)
VKHVLLTTSTDRLHVARLEHAERRHRELDGRIQELKRKGWLSPAEQVEVTRLKKMKLQAKDEIASLSTTARRTPS